MNRESSPSTGAENGDNGSKNGWRLEGAASESCVRNRRGKQDKRLASRHLLWAMAALVLQGIEGQDSVPLPIKSFTRRGLSTPFHPFERAFFPHRSMALCVDSMTDSFQPAVNP